MSAYFQEIKEFAKDQFEKANNATRVMRLSNSSANVNNRQLLAEGYGDVIAKALSDNPDFVELKEGWGKKVWAVLLAIDLRNSSSRAIRIGAKDTYLTMHTFLPTMINLVGCCNGSIVGLRGDGLIAQFGDTEIIDDSTKVDSETASAAATNAVGCGKAMIETVQEIINPLLRENAIEDTLSVGIGVEHGKIVVTRIGHLTANELTAYGPAVNKACKFSNQVVDKVRVTTAVQDLYPSGENGRISFSPARLDSGGLIVQFPDDHRELLPQPIRKTK